MTTRRYALIPTHNRHNQLAALVRSLQPQCDHIIVVDNASTPRVTALWLAAQLDGSPDGRPVVPVVIRDDEQPPNLSRLWNRGLDLIAQGEKAFGGREWDVAVLNDDAVVPEEWFSYVVGALRADTAHVACTNAYGVSHAPLLKTTPDRDITTRMCPWAFVVRGELGQRADESFRWWWGDTDWDWTARQRGGVLILPGFTVANTGANSSTVGELAVQAGRDGQYFERKWGMRPW